MKLINQTVLQYVLKYGFVCIVIYHNTASVLQYVLKYRFVCIVIYHNTALTIYFQLFMNVDTEPKPERHYFVQNYIGFADKTPNQFPVKQQRIQYNQMT